MIQLFYIDHARHFFFLWKSCILSVCAPFCTPFEKLAKTKLSVLWQMLLSFVQWMATGYKKNALSIYCSRVHNKHTLNKNRTISICLRCHIQRCVSIDINLVGSLNQNSFYMQMLLDDACFSEFMFSFGSLWSQVILGITINWTISIIQKCDVHFFVYNAWAKHSDANTQMIIWLHEKSRDT